MNRRTPDRRSRVVPSGLRGQTSGQPRTSCGCRSTGRSCVTPEQVLTFRAAETSPRRTTLPPHASAPLVSAMHQGMGVGATCLRTGVRSRTSDRHPRRRLRVRPPSGSQNIQRHLCTSSSHGARGLCRWVFWAGRSLHLTNWFLFVVGVRSPLVLNTVTPLCLRSSHFPLTGQFRSSTSA